MPRPSDRTQGFCQDLADDLRDLEAAAHAEDWPAFQAVVKRMSDRIENFPHDKVDRHL